MILVISYPDEDHTVQVVGRLREAGREVGLLCLSDFPARASIELSWSPAGTPTYVVNGPDGRFDLGQVRVAWWRRILPFEIDPQVRKPLDRAFSESETSQAVNGVLDALDCQWVNQRAADESAHRKPTNPCARPSISPRPEAVPVRRRRVFAPGFILTRDGDGRGWGRLRGPALAQS